MRLVTRIAAILAAPAILASAVTTSASAHAGNVAGPAAPRFTACLVTDTGGLNDHSFNELTWRGMMAANKAAPDKIKVLRALVSLSAADYAAFIAVFVRENCSLIITVGFLMASATEAAAKAHPRHKFAIVDCTYRSGCLTGKRLKNLDQLAFNVAQDGFLGGYLAAGMSKTHVVATYGGLQFGTVTIYMDGFADGVRYYNSQHHTHVKVLGWNERTQKGVFAGTFVDRSAGAKIARSFMRKGADVIFPVAGGTGLGTASAVRAANAKGKKVSIEWADVDGCFQFARFCTLFMTTVAKGIAREVKAVVLAAVDGRFPTKYVGTLADRGVALAPYHHFARKVPARLKAELRKVAAKIESGKVRPATKSPV